MPLNVTQWLGFLDVKFLMNLVFCSLSKGKGLGADVDYNFEEDGLGDDII